MTGCASSGRRSSTLTRGAPGVRVDVLELGGVDHRPVDADAQVAAAAARHDAAVAGAEAAGHAGLERELRGRARLRAQSARTPSSIAGGPAGVDDRVRVALELRGEQLGDEAVVADRSRRRWRCARRRSSAAPAARARVAEAEQHDVGVALAAGPASVSCRIASGAMPTPPPTSSARRRRSRGAR